MDYHRPRRSHYRQTSMHMLYTRALTAKRVYKHAPILEG